MDIKYEIEPIFKIEFFKIQCINLKTKEKTRESISKISRNASS